MKRENLGFTLSLMRNWWWAKWDWWECSSCKMQVRNERYWVVFEPMRNINFCMDCCKTKQDAIQAYGKLKEQRRLNRPPPPPCKPAKPEYRGINRDVLKKILASYVRLLHSKPVLLKEDYEVIEIVNKLMEGEE